MGKSVGTGKDEVDHLQQDLDAILKPRGFPVAFRMFKNHPEAKEYAVKSRLALCQIIKAVNIYGDPYLLEQSNPQACADGEHVLGFHEHPSALAERWEFIFGLNRRSHEKLVKDIIHIPFGEYHAALFAPLQTFEEQSVHPDGVILNVNGMQAELLILGSYLASQEKPAWSYNGYAACEIVAALKNGKTPWLVIPCLGARSFCSTQDDELWFGAGIENLRAIVYVLKQDQLHYPPSVEQSVLKPPLEDHLITKLMNPR